MYDASLHNAVVSAAIGSVGDLPDLIIIVAPRYFDELVFTHHDIGPNEVYVATSDADMLLKTEEYWRPQPGDEVVICSDQDCAALMKHVRKYTKSVVRRVNLRLQG